ALTDNFHKAMDNDFNTAQALGHIFEAVKGLNTVLQALPRKPAESDLELLGRTSETVRELAGLMGLLQEDPTGYIKRKQEETLDRLNIDRTAIDNLIRQRAEARAAKDWSRADEIRDKLAGWNIELKDSPEGTTWQVKIT
ncbi:MAG: DALR domain-containing protein, partial [Thermodesulfobacteriota bacterium]